MQSTRNGKGKVTYSVFGANFNEMSILETQTPLFITF